MTSNWKSRVVRSALVNPGSLLEHPDNITIHTEEQEQEMVLLLSKVGWAAPVLVSERSGRIIDGHMRVSLALRRGEVAIPVDYVDLTEEEERKALLYLKRTTMMARIDTVNLEAVLAEIVTEDDEIAAMIASFEKESGLLDRKKREAPREVVQFMNVTIGPLTFPVSWPSYVHWRGMMQAQFKTPHATINYEIRKRLGLL